MIDATVTGTGLSVRGLEGMTVHAMVGYDAGARHALVRRVEAKAPFGELTAEGELAVEPTGTSRLRAEASGIDAAAIMHALNRAQSQRHGWPPPSTPHGPASTTSTPPERRTWN